MPNIFATVTTKAIVGTVAIILIVLAADWLWHKVGGWITRASAKLDADIAGVLGAKKEQRR